MTERGFPNYKVPAGETEISLLLKAGFEPLTVADARARGYEERYSLATAALEEQSRTMSDAEMQALNGTEGKGGCQQEATRAVYGSEESYETIRKVYITAVHYLNNDAIIKDLWACHREVGTVHEGNASGRLHHSGYGSRTVPPEQPRHPRTGD